MTKKFEKGSVIHVASMCTTTLQRVKSIDMHLFSNMYLSLGYRYLVNWSSALDIQKKQQSRLKSKLVICTCDKAF